MSVRKNLRYFIPLGLTFCIGTILTILIFNLAFNKVREEFTSQFNSKADSIGFSLDLMIAHNTIRLQNFEEKLSLDLKTGNQNFILATLNSSVFSVFNFFKQESKEGDQELELKRVLRVDAQKDGQSISSDSNSAFMTNVELLKAIKKMIQSKDKFISMFLEVDQRVYFFLVMRSTVHPGNLYVFSGNVVDLFSSYVQISQQSQVILHQKNDDTLWLISHVDAVRKIAQIKRINSQDRDELVESSEVRRDYNEKFVGDAFDIVVFSNHIQQTNFFWPLVVLGCGTLITLLISLLFYSLISRNIDVENQVRIKTVDLEIQTEKALEAAAAKSRFLANISHEIRTPLNIILGTTDLLQETELNQQQNKFLNSLRTSGNHLISLIEDVLDMARIDLNDVEFKETKVNLVDLFEDVCRIVAPNISKKKLKFYANVDLQLPSVVLTDPSRLRQIFINLINNSVKFTESGYILASLKRSEELTAPAGQIWVDLVVEDTGIGIPAKNQSDVFKAFFQVNPAVTRQKGGVGLGLSIVRAIVERMSGQILLSSDLGSGAKFLTQIPFSVLDGTSWINQNGIDRIKKLQKIIFVSDDKQLCNSAIKYLEHIANKVHLFGSGELEFDEVRTADGVIIDRSCVSEELIKMLSQISLGKVLTLNHDVHLRDQNGSYLLPLMPTSVFSCFDVFTKSEKEMPSVVSTGAYLKVKKLDLVVVDDDESNRDLIAAYLKDLSWSVRYAEDGQMAYELCVEKSPDILVADLQMPNMDGFTLSRKVREYQRKEKLKFSKIVILTADALEETAELAKQQNVDLYLTKPIRKNKFIDSIQDLAKGSS
jgi:signal transduction histidine kinase/ActR/RegA family two-component response regulator